LALPPVKSSRISVLLHFEIVMLQTAYLFNFPYPSAGPSDSLQRSIGFSIMTSRVRLIAAIVLPVLLLGACGRGDRAVVSKFLENRTGAVFVFLAPDCPLSQSYTSTLNELHAQFEARGIEVYGVFAGTRASAGADEFTMTYRLRFPVLRDQDFRMADFLRAQQTPEAFLLDATGSVVYSGAIDNRAPELGQQRTVITATYLLDALNSLIEHRQPPNRRIPAIGCFIERSRPA
jgi:peroxiredoxin